MTVPKMAALLGPDKMYFSYNQFMVYDSGEKLPGSDWKDEHVSQGFARREFSIGFGTLLQFGHASVRVFIGSPAGIEEYERVVSVPLNVKSGDIRIEGPEEYPVERKILVSPGWYQVIVAQIAKSDEVEQIDIYLKSISSDSGGSSVILADEGLNPPKILLESAEIAG
jgi:Competence protein J (ComJ)